jgi:hypothetical protein
MVIVQVDRLRRVLSERAAQFRRRFQRFAMKHLQPLPIINSTRCLIGGCPAPFLMHRASLRFE